LRVDDVLAAAEACTARYSESLDAPPSEGDASCPAVENIGSEDPALERIEARQAVAQAVSALGARERELIRLRFFEQRTQTEIAARLGISQMQVSRLLRKVLSRLHTLAAG
jgi:RNA polymerase sigma-B factor